MVQRMQARWRIIGQEHRPDISGDPAMLNLSCSCGADLGHLPQPRGMPEAAASNYTDVWTASAIQRHQIAMLLSEEEWQRLAAKGHVEGVGADVGP